MSNKIYVIENDDCIILFYVDLEKAKYELKRIYEMTADSTYCGCGYVINVYDLVDNEYKLTNIRYTYQFDTFLCG